MDETKSKVRRPRQARSKATVEAILEATSQVLRRDGLEGATTSTVAKRAGVSVGTLYQYFPNREALFETLIDLHLARRMASRAAMLSAGPASDDLVASIGVMVDALLEANLEDPDLQRELHRYEAANGLKRLDGFQRLMIQVVQAQLEAHADRLRPMDAALAAQVLVYAVVGVVERLVREDPLLAGRADVRHEVVALVAGFLSPLNPVRRATRSAPR